MAHELLDLAVGAPAFGNTFVEVPVAASSRVVPGGVLRGTAVGVPGPYAAGAGAASRISCDPSVPAAYLDEATGVLHLPTAGAAVVPPGGPAAAASFELLAVAHSNAVTAAEAERWLLDGGYAALPGDSLAVSSGAASVALRPSGLEPGTAYTVAVHAWDEAEGQLATALASGATAHDPVFDEASAARGVTEAVLSYTVTDPDSSDLLRAAAVPLSADPSEVAAGLAAGTHGGPVFEALLSPGTSSVSATVGGLSPGTHYRAVAVALDPASGHAEPAPVLPFATYASPRVGVEVTGRGYSSVEARSTHTFEMGGVDVATGVVPDTAEDVAAFLEAGADPLGNRTSTHYPSAGTYTASFGASGLERGGAYAAVAVAVPGVQPGAAAHDALSFATARPPVISLGEPVAGFVDAVVPFTVSDPDASVNVYAAVHPAGSHPPAAAAAELIARGSAFPGAVVAVGVPWFSGDASGAGLEPGGEYFATVVAVEAEDPSLVTRASVYFRTAPAPSLEVTPGGFTDSGLTAGVVSSGGRAHDLFVRVTPYVVAGSVVYDPDAIAATPQSDSNTLVVPNSASNAVEASFGGLLEHTEYGIVAVAADPATGLVLAHEAVAAKTAALPDVSVSVEHVTYRSVGYRVSCEDRDGPFRLLTAVSGAPFSGAEAGALAEEGLWYAGGGVVPGSVTDLPNDAGDLAVEAAHSHSNLDGDTSYYAVAVAVDAGSGQLRWAQRPFLTDFRPTASVASVSASSFSATAELLLADRDGPLLSVRYGAYEAPAAEAAGLLAADPAARTLSSVGRGPRGLEVSLEGLAEATRYHLAVVATAPDGTASEVATAPFETDARPVVSLSLGPVLARSLSAAAEVLPPGGASYDAAVAVLPHGTEVGPDLLRAVLSGAAPALGLDRAPGRTGALSMDSEFGGLAPGSRVAVLAAACRDDGEEDFVHAASNLYLRVEPSVAALAPAVTSGTVRAGFLLSYDDPDAGRSNSADLAVAAVPSGHDYLAWLPAAAAGAGAGASASNPALPQAPVLLLPGAGSAADSYSASGLEPATAYDLVVLAADAALGRAFVAVAPFATRARVSLSAAVASVAPDSAAVDFSASLPDGTFSLRASVFQDATGSGEPLESWFGVAAASGEPLASGASFAAERHAFRSLSSRTAYVAVAVAVDDLSGEAFRAHAPFFTGAHPPSVRVVQGSAVATSTGATLRVLARDADSDFTCFARAFPVADADPVGADAVEEASLRPDFSRALRPSSAETPLAVTVSGLEPDTAYRLVAVARDSVTGSNAHDFEDFRTLRTEDFLQRVEYDGAYTLSWRRSATYGAPARGVQVSNGKVAFRTRLDDVMGVSDVCLAGSFDLSGYGGYTNNVVGGFDASAVSLFDHSLGESPAAFTLESQALDMQTGVVLNRGRLLHPATGAALAVEQDIVPLRHMPHCTLTMYRLTPEADLPSLALFHEMCAGDGMDSVSYDSVTVYQPSLAMSVPVFQGRASLRQSSHTVAAATIYLFDEPSAGTPRHSGFNTFRNSDRAFDAHLLGPLPAGRPFLWATLTAQATSADFSRPEHELPRLLMHTAASLSAGSANPHDVAARLRAAHVSAWARLWATSVSVQPKPGLTAEDALEFRGVRRALRFAQYQLFSSVRDHGASELNPLHLSSVDLDGNVFWNRELWLVPALLYSRPSAVRGMLEARYESLGVATTLAAAQGHPGARFPYASDPASYGAAAPFWDVASAGYVFNTALVAVAAWDYFRATHDRDWLTNKGYRILASIADYICSVASLDPATGAASFPDVLDTNGRRVTDPSFTVYSCRSALRAAVESTYELRYPTRDAWARTHAGLSLRFHPPPAPPGVVRHHASASPSERLDLLEPLMLLQPHYVEDFARGDVGRYSAGNLEALLNNAAHYSAAASPAYQDNPFNTLLRLGVYAQANRHSGLHSATCKALLAKALADGERDIWGALSASPDSPHNDVSLSALLVLSFLTAFAGLHVGGGVAQSGFYYVPFGVRAHATTHLPDTWQAVVATTAGDQTFHVLNSALYDP